MQKNDLAVAEALTWLGTPYHHQGRVKGVGVDSELLNTNHISDCG